MLPSNDTIILVTGCAGFIGFHISNQLLTQGYRVIGIDNLNDYYDVSLKKSRLGILTKKANFVFYKQDITNKEEIVKLGKTHPDISYIVHLAAQAGVRYSLIDPYAYTHSNVTGHLTILELARNLPALKHLTYASSSSVYGANTKLPFAISDRTDTPLSLYAATKKSCELMSYCYSTLYKIPVTGLRFFTVYGPWGRPDMAAFIFTKAILAGKPIPVYNRGDMRRNFTYIDDIVQGTINCLFKPLTTEPDLTEHKVYNIGNDRSESLMDFIYTLEKHLGKTALLDFQPMQPGDVKETTADINDTKNDFGFKPVTNITQGIEKFITWYRNYYINSDNSEKLSELQI